MGLALLSAGAAWLIAHRYYSQGQSLLSPLIESGTSAKPKPLQAYSIVNLSQRQYQTSHITIEKELSKTADYTSYLFSYTTLNKKMTGQLNIPVTPIATPTPVVIMLRGYVDPAIYQTGVGTKNGAAFFAKNGFITIAPDFFGYGGSDPEPSDVWQARFEKPITVIELLKTLQVEPIQLPNQKLTLGKIGIWGHSNGGQIAVSTLEILNQPIPTTLWAPVTAPFPYSLLYFSDEDADEGKAMRAWIADFEKTYDVYDFSLTDHMDRLVGPLQLHHGTNDDSALKAWSDAFSDKIKTINKARAEELKTASLSATTDTTQLQPITFNYYIYPGADHNLQPAWQTVIDRDVSFFKQNLLN